MSRGHRIVSPMPTGSGAIVVHRALERQLQDYHVRPYNPWLTLLPPLLPAFSSHCRGLIHTGADYAYFSARPRKPLVVTFHNYVLDRYMKPYSSRLQWLHYRTDLRAYTRLALRHADAVTAVSAATAELVREDLGYRGNIRIIANGIDLAAFSPQIRTPSGEFRAAFSGSFSRRKGANWLAGIASHLPEEIRIVCIGQRRADAAEAEVAQLRFEGAVPHERMPAFYASCDALLMPTVREGMSLAALEAMAMGLPIVATDCASMRELVAEGNGGFLCPLGDVAAFAERLRWLAAHPEQARQMGAFNRARALAQHDVGLMASRYEEIFSGCLGRP